jgi:hypothetical protein
VVPKKGDHKPVRLWTLGSAPRPAPYGTVHFANITGLAGAVARDRLDQIFAGVDSVLVPFR